MYINHKNKYILYIITIIGNDLTEKDKMFSILINTSQIYIFILLFKTKKNFGNFLIKIEIETIS